MKLMIFDLDGTLLDTLPDLTDSVNFAMTMLGLRNYSRAEVGRMVGNGMTVTLTRALGQGNITLLDEAKRLQAEYYSAHCNDKTVPFDGINRLLERLKSDNVHVAVYSNKDQAFAEATCAAHFGDEVDFVVGTGPDGVTKPDAKRLQARIDEIGATKCMYCGDSEVDIMTAANADMPCVSVTWGYRTREELVASGATMVADTAEQVYDFAQKFFA